MPTASASNRGALSSADWSTFNGKQGTITLTTTGTSGAATFSANTLNIPNYADGGVLSLSAIGGTANANAATITGTVLNLQPADASFGGVVTTGVQTFAGAKTLTAALSGTSGTFSSDVTAVGNLRLGTNNTVYIQIKNSTGTYSNLVHMNASDRFVFDGSSFGVTFQGGVTFASAITGTSATFSSTATATAFIPSGATVPTNGMYLSAANTLDFATNTTNRLSIASTGAATFSSTISAGAISTFYSGGAGTAGQIRLGYDATAYWQIGRLDPAGTGSGNFQFKPNAGTSVFDITSAGNVGIGTTSPSEKLTIEGAVIRLQGGVGVTPFAIANNDSDGFRIYDYTAAATRFRIATTGAATFSSSITTAAPSGGTAKPFKVGAVSETGPAIINKVMVEIDSVVYYIPLSAAVV